MDHATGTYLGIPLRLAARLGDTYEQKQVEMRLRLTWLVSISSAILASTIVYSAGVWGTNADTLFKSKTLYKGTFAEIDVSNHSSAPNIKDHPNAYQWLSSQKTEGLSDLYVQNNIWAPGGSTGWHTHLGHNLIIVTEGTVTAYEGMDPGCKPHVFTKGMTFVDPGGDHVHIIRNESGAEAQTIAVQLVPASAARFIEVPDPGNCHF